jgi:hypothetical protein
MWVDLLSAHCNLRNYSETTSSNLLIARQVDQALQYHADFVIVHFSSCTRGEKPHAGKYVPFSYHTASKITTPFESNALRILKEYYTEFFDLDLAIYQNAITIEHTLARLVQSGRPFRFDQGGFEHVSYGGTGQYFAQYTQYRSQYNLWDHATARHYRPYYHIRDQQIHQKVAEYYQQEIAK